MPTASIQGAWVPTFPNPGDPPSAVVEVSPQQFSQMPTLYVEMQRVRMHGDRAIS